MDNTHSTENNSTSEWRKREMGALWTKTGKSQQFYSGFFKLNKGQPDEQEVKIVVFLNKMKSSEKAPDLIVYESTEQSASFISHDQKVLPPKEDKPSLPSGHDDIPDSFLE